MLCFLKESYIYTILRHFSIENSKRKFTSLDGIILSLVKCFSTLNEIKRNETSSVIGSLVYAMMCIKLDISFAVGIVA